MGTGCSSRLFLAAAFVKGDRVFFQQRGQAPFFGTEPVPECRVLEYSP